MSRAKYLQFMWLASRSAARFSTRLSGFFAWQLWFTPWHVPLSDRAREREAGWTASTRPLRIRAGRKTLAAFTAGDGPTVLLVHGWGDRASRMGAFIAPLVDAGFRVVGLDLPAHGDSPGVRTDAYEAAEAIRSAAEQVGPLYAIVAHSMGGAETLMAVAGGVPVQRLVLLAPALRPRHAMDKFTAMFSMPQRAMTGLVKAIERRYGTQVWDDLSSDLNVADLDVPALLFHDRTDPQVDFADGEALHAAWRGSRFVPTEGLAHDRLLRDPTVVAQTVDFLIEGPPRLEVWLEQRVTASASI